MRNLRTNLSRLRAQVLNIAGIKSGFFVQYGYASSLKSAGEYPEFRDLFAASDYSEFLSHMSANMPRVREIWPQSRMFSPLDSTAAYSAVRLLDPARILEIGSGNSTHIMATALKDMGSRATLTCIDPQPRRDIGALEVNFLRRVLSADDVKMCDELEANDILFIDSSHIMLPQMDVDIQFNRMFPRLKRGVVVHVHDIFLPDDYPKSWEKRHYSEQNALMGWILSGYFEVIYPGWYVGTRFKDQLAPTYSGWDAYRENSNSGSIWLRRT